MRLALLLVLLAAPPSPREAARAWLKAALAGDAAALARSSAAPFRAEGFLSVEAKPCPAKVGSGELAALLDCVAGDQWLRHLARARATFREVTAAEARAELRKRYPGEAGPFGGALAPELSEVRLVRAELGRSDRLLLFLAVDARGQVVGAGAYPQPAADP